MGYGFLEVRGLENRHRSGRPPEVSEETSAILRKELSENHSGWMAKEVMNLRYKRTGVKYRLRVLDYSVVAIDILNKLAKEKELPIKLQFIDVGNSLWTGGWTFVKF